MYDITRLQISLSCNLVLGSMSLTISTYTCEALLINSSYANLLISLHILFSLLQTTFPVFIQSEQYLFNTAWA